jgi:hypothetical protein
LLFIPSSPLRKVEAQTAANEVSFPVAIGWNTQAGIHVWRLQIAADEKFQDVFLDRRVMGQKYLVAEIPAGYYFWRVAPADSQAYSSPVRFFISGGVVTTVGVSNREPRVKSHRPGRTTKRAQ